ncbi:hypothetical protein KTT_23270 [Tengunoibacter tsumagoiensis]|uniref:Uncharacterized protein n=1 Tax=Tengunoibacter tsumagoiensis TaxID=2014871 RepID=A0A402A009_9CHLR|nr:hypothetical protein KTT_23270 [Tengunoibacter tsumagoiensis]
MESKKQERIQIQGFTHSVDRGALWEKIHELSRRHDGNEAKKEVGDKE